MGEPIRETPGMVAIYPTTERKGRAKAVQLVLRPSSLEIHKSAKDVKNNKEPKYNIELSELFNICLDNEPNQIKNECISLMTTEMTFFLLPMDLESSLNDWFELLMERIRGARSEKLLRPVFREEFFEAAWDVNIIKKPKLRKEYPKVEKVEDLADKLADIQGRKRLCISPTCFLLFKMKVSPTADGDQPFDKESYTELPLNVISNYGKQEKYFFLRVGRCSEIGSGELWMATESGNSATQLHERLSKINQRDAEKRRQEGVMLSLGGISSRVLKSRLLRERAQQSKNRDSVGSEVRSRTNTMTMNLTDPSEVVRDPSPTPETMISIPTPPLASPQLASVDKIKEESKSSKKSSFADMASKIQSKFHYSSSSSATGGTFTTNPEYSDNPETSSMEITSTFAPPLRQDSNPQRTLSPRHYKNIAEDYMSYDPIVDSRKASAAYTAPIRQISVMSATDSVTLPQEQIQPSQIEDNSDYVRMKSRTGPVMTENLRFPIKEARSYVSDHDSTESCYSAIKRARRDSNSDFGDDQSHGQRAFSLGSKPPLKTVPLSHHREDFDEIKSEDIRKRAHSAGSKTWGLTAQRKISEGNDMRSRTGSMGNQFRKKEKNHPESDDHVEMEFSEGSKQGSLASIDSPNVRSRNSSFGVQGASSIRSAVDSAITRLRVLATADELNSKIDDNPRPTSSRDIHSNIYPSIRRSSAPENPVIYSNDSDYVQITCPKKKRTIETITESAYSSSSEHSTPDSISDTEISLTKKPPNITKRPSLQGQGSSSGSSSRTGPTSSLEYAIINPQLTVSDIDSSMIQPAMSFFNCPGGSSTPPLPSNSSPQYPQSTSGNNCEYTVIHAPNKN